MSSQNSFFFHRPELAKTLADALLGKTPFNYRSGLFLAAPRRTGKSDFLRRDLVPEMQKQGQATLYVDLWSDKSVDPAVLIAETIKTALRQADNLAMKAVRAAGLSKLGIGPFASFDIDKIGASQGITLSDALEALAARTRKDVTLIVDEAQHALTTEAGINSMFALKAARDAMNQGQSSGKLTLVFTGSHRDKLSNLMLRRDQPFFGASFVDFPKLDKNYTDALTGWMNERLDADNRFEADDVFSAFEILAHRPEMLETAMKDFALGSEKSAGLKKSLIAGATALRERLWEDYDRDFSQLTPLQKATLGVIIDRGERFVPFAAETLSALSNVCGRKVEASEMQASLDALRQKDIIWRSARATYTLEDQSMAEWFLARHKTP